MSLTPVEINDQFARALELMNVGGRPLFVTGRAGTGKSTLLRYFRETTERQVVVLAPTGVAAVNIGGQTIHSFFGFRPDITIEKARRAARKIVDQERDDIYRKIETLIIDEISMVRADLFDCVDAFLRVARGEKELPFGGVHLVMIGDLYQLPPIVTSHEREIFEHHYASPYFFDSKVFAEMGMELIELEKVYRQHDRAFIELLNAVRNNTLDDKGIAFLNRRCITNDQPWRDGFVYLTALNRDADLQNAQQLAALKGKAREYLADISGDFDQKSYPADARLELKVGAQVMLLNNDSAGRWINGTMGMLVRMDRDVVSVRLQEGGAEEIEPITWQMFRFGLDQRTKAITSEAIGKFRQLPLMLAWAITIHKSQGKTFDRAVIDIGRAFAPGQAYVALSRLRSLDGMILRYPLKKNQVRVDRRVMEFLTSHHYRLSEKAEPLDHKLKVIRDAIEEGSLLEITYLKASDVKSTRAIQPLEVGEMTYAGKSFIAVRGRCLLRNDERVFRVDRILEMRVKG